MERQELILMTESTLRRIFVEALLEYSDRINYHNPIIEEKRKKKLHSIEELAKFINVSNTTAQKYKNEGMPCIQYLRKIIFDQDEVMAWLKESKHIEK